MSSQAEIDWAALAKEIGSEAAMERAMREPVEEGEVPSTLVFPDISYYLTQRGLSSARGMRYVFTEESQNNASHSSGDTQLEEQGRPNTVQLTVEIDEGGFFLVLMDSTSTYAKSTFSGLDQWAKVYNPHLINPPANDASILFQGYITRDDSWSQQFFPHLGYSYELYCQPSEIEERYKNNAERYLAHEVHTGKREDGTNDEKDIYGGPPSFTEHLLARGSVIVV